MKNLAKNIAEAANFIKKKTTLTPKVGVILGTGLSALGGASSEVVEIDFADIPHFPEPTVSDHAGKLVIEELDGRAVVTMHGRLHYYEGYSLAEVTFPVRVLKAIGVEVLLISNACGGLNPIYKSGDIMVINDHINFFPDNPLRGWNDDNLGPRYTDMCEPYDLELVKMTKEIALAQGIAVQEGVYVGVPGPNLETRAEYRMLRQVGGDVVGMSTVPENIVAIHAGIKVIGLSIVTDECLPDALKPVNIEHIIACANATEPKLRAIVDELIRRLG